MRNRRKTLLRDHSVPEVTLKVCPKHAQSQPYLRPSQFEDLKDLPSMVDNPTSEISVPQEDNRYFSFNLFWLKTGIKLRNLFG